MFGADTPLVIDALQIAAIALVAGGAATWAVLKRRRATASGQAPEARSNHEDRIRVLERIATDRSADLADEIESLRDEKREKELS